MAIQYRSGTAYRSSTHYDGTGGSGVVSVAVIYDQTGGYTYDDPRLLYDAGYFSTASLSMRARIRAVKQLSAKARIAQRQGWPIPNPSDGNYSIWQPTQLYFRARLSNNIAISNQAMRMKGRVTYRTVSQSLQCKAHIGRGATLQMRANIRPQFVTSSVQASFYVQRTSQTPVRVVFYIQGMSQNQTLGLKARIVGRYASRCTGHFIVATPVAFSPVVVLKNPNIVGRTLQTVSMRTRIVK